MKNYIVEDYLEHLQESRQGAGFLIIGGLIYAAYKNWKNRQEIINGYCKKFKGDSIRLDLCVAESQVKNAEEIIKQLRRSQHTCEDTKKPQRCYEKVRYYLNKYNEKIVHLNQKIYKLKLKLAQRDYREKLKKQKQKYKK